MISLLLRFATKFSHCVVRLKSISSCNKHAIVGFQSSALSLSSSLNLVTNIDHEQALKEEGMADAIAAYKKCNASQEMRYLIEAREKAQRDQVSRLNYAREQGLQQGRQEGALEGQLKTLLMLFRNGLLPKDKTIEQMQSLLGQNNDEIVQSFLRQLG